MSLREQLAELQRIALSSGRFRKRWRILAGLAAFTLAAPGSLLLLGLFDWILPLPAWPLVLLFAAACAVVLWAVARFLFRPLLGRVDLETEAKRIEARVGTMDNALIGALQLGTEYLERGPDRLGHSPQLVESLVRDCAERYARLDYRRLEDRSRARRLIAGAAAVLLAIALVGTYGRAAIEERMRRLDNAWAIVLDTLFPITMEVSPEGARIVRGTSIALRVNTKGARRQEVRLALIDPATGQRVLMPLLLENQSATHTVDEVMEDFSFQFEYAGRYSPVANVLVDDLPEIRTVNYELSPPEYTGQSVRLLTGRLNRLEGLAGTGVMMSLAATTELHPERCWIEWLDSGERERLEVSGRFATFAFLMNRSERAADHLTGRYGPGFEMAEPMRFAVVVQPDQPPTLRLLVRRQEDATADVEVANALNAPFLAQDDFGVAEVTLHYTVEAITDLLGRDKREGTRQLRFDPPRERATGRFENLFDGLQPALSAGDRVTVWLTAMDNNTETGPGHGRSESLEMLLIGTQFGAFTESSLDFRDRERSALMLESMGRVARETGLLQEAVRTVRTQPHIPVPQEAVSAAPAQHSMLGQTEDELGRYFELLSGAGP